MYVTAINYKNKPGKFQIVIQGKLNNKTIDKRKVISANNIRHAKQLAEEFYQQMCAAEFHNNNNQTQEPIVEKPTKTISFMDFQPIYFNYIKAKQRKQRTIDCYNDWWRLHYIPLFGKLKISEITKAHFQKLLAERNYLSPSVLNDLMINFRSIIKLASQEPYNYYPFPVPDIKDLKLKTTTNDENDDIKWWTKPEIKTVLDTAKSMDERFYLFLVLGINAGLRISELCSVKWDDIDFKQSERYQNGVICVRRTFYKFVQKEDGKVDFAQSYTLPKGGRSRTVPLTKTLREALLAAKKNSNSQWVFPATKSERIGMSATDKTLTRWFEKVTEKAFGEKSANTHIMRHTFVMSVLQANNGNVVLAQKLAGHAQVSITMRYVKLLSTQRSDGINKMDEFLSE